MSKIQKLISGLTDHDDKKTYDYLKQLQEKCNYSSCLYSFFDIFVEMLVSDNSYQIENKSSLVLKNWWPSRTSSDSLYQCNRHNQIIFIKCAQL